MNGTNFDQNDLSPTTNHVQPNNTVDPYGLLTLKHASVQNETTKPEIIQNHIASKSPVQRQSHLSPTLTHETFISNSDDNNSFTNDFDNVVDLNTTECDQQQQQQLQPMINETHDASIDDNASNLNKSFESLSTVTTQLETLNIAVESRGSIASRSSGRKSRTIIRKFQKLDESMLSSTPAPDVKIGQRVAYKEYYGNEFGTIRWIGRVPQICPDWTVGVEFDNAIGEGDGSLNGRRYFIAKDCFAKFLPLAVVKLVDQHVGRPEPGTMISVMSAAVRPGQMISIQRVSTVHVQHCFLNAPHRRPGADILAVNTRLHCQCPNCGPCAHVIKPPRTQRLARSGKNATHMCQFSTYTCCGMESQEETMCTYEGNKVISLPPPPSSSLGLPPVGNSWIEGSGYLTNLQYQQTKLMPEEYRLGTAPEDIGSSHKRTRNKTSRRGSGKHQYQSNKYSYHNETSDIINPQNIATEQLKEPTNDEHQSSQDRVLDDNFKDAVSNQASPLTLANPVEYRSHNSLEVANIDKQTSYSHEEKNHTTNNNDWNDNNVNRYLFPDSFPVPSNGSIDSSIEHDLENLSQARYGNCGNPRTNGNGSKNILIRSLRSLVSCLSAHNSNSEFDIGDCVDNGQQTTDTIRYSEELIQADNKCIDLNIEQGNELIYSECDTFKQKEFMQNISYVKNHSQEDGLSYTKNFHDLPYHHQIMAKKESNTYSSSDCGFSSASQNSINYPNKSPMSQHPIISNADAKVYERIIMRLLSSSSLTHEDTTKLKSILGESHKDHCCLHKKTSLNSYSSTEMDQIIADVIKNSMDMRKFQVNRANSTTCYRTNVDNNQYQAGERILKNPSGCNQENSKEILHKCCQNESCRQSPRSLIDGSTAESVTLGSNDSFQSSVGACEIDGKNIKIETKNNESLSLSKAFELKLTLSINNSDKKDQTNLLVDSNKTSINNTDSGLSDKSDFQINANSNTIENNPNKEGTVDLIVKESPVLERTKQV